MFTSSASSSSGSAQQRSWPTPFLSCMPGPKRSRCLFYSIYQASAFGHRRGSSASPRFLRACTRRACRFAPRRASTRRPPEMAFNQNKFERNPVGFDEKFAVRLAVAMQKNGVEREVPVAHLDVRRRLVVAAEHEDGAGEEELNLAQVSFKTNLVAEKEGDGLRSLRVTIHVVAQEQVVLFRREAQVVQYLQAFSCPKNSSKLVRVGPCSDRGGRLRAPVEDQSEGCIYHFQPKQTSISPEFCFLR